MKYTNQTFTLPVCAKPMTELDYDFAVGKISQEQYDLAIAARDTVQASLDNLKNMCFSS